MDIAETSVLGTSLTALMDGNDSLFTIRQPLSHKQLEANLESDRGYHVEALEGLDISEPAKKVLKAGYNSFLTDMYAHAIELSKVNVVVPGSA
jgi:hypothetical protein